MFRVIRSIALALVLGALTAFVVAQFIAEANPRLRVGGGSKGQGPSGARWSLSVWGVGYRDVMNLSASPGAGPITAEDLAEARAALPHSTWRSRLDASVPAAARGGFWNYQAWGWPRPCVASGFLNPGGGGVSWGRFETGIGGRIYMLHYGVIPEGLALGAAVFAAPWWLLLLVPGAVRRALRRRGGRCGKCGYDLKGDFSAGCPECGWNRHAAAVASTIRADAVPGHRPG